MQKAKNTKKLAQNCLTVRKTTIQEKYGAVSDFPEMEALPTIWVGTSSNLFSMR